jgi:hypothetical protein
MVTNDHDRMLQEKVRALPRRNDPPGWQPIGSYAIGGLSYVGFSRKQELLLVISSQGIGIYDLEQEKFIYRDRDGDLIFNVDETNLTYEGVDVLAGERIDLCGLTGGGLPTFTDQGDEIFLAGMDWPRGALVFIGGFNNSLHNMSPENSCILYEGYIDHFGFSWSRNYLIVTDEDLHLWKRVPANRSETRPA